VIAFIQKKSKGNRIVILGFGLEGKSILRFLLTEKSMFSEIVVLDQNDMVSQQDLILENDIKCYTGDDYQSQLTSGDFIIKSPGVKLIKAFNTFSQTSLFLEYYQKQIIGITGTKGKSTTSSMIYQVLKDQAKDVILVGNIGKPAFDTIKEINADTLIVYELSAHQLQYVWQGSKYAILLNLMPEHLDYFDSEIDYYTAKLNIFRRQGQESFSYIPETATAAVPDEVSLKTKLENQTIVSDGKMLLDKHDLKYLYGDHHISNIHPVIELVLFLDLDLEKALQTIREFRPLPHRQEFLGDKDGLIFINDSISTIPQSAIQAVQSIKKVDYLILGGVDRGIDYTVLIDFLSQEHFIKVFFLGKAGERMLRELVQRRNGLNFGFQWAENLQSIKRELLEIDTGTVLLSPAAASYDAFDNFEARGDYFRDIFFKK